MGLIEVLVRQSGKPSGVLGWIMIKIMDHVDSGLNSWILHKINYPKGSALEIGCGGGETIFNLLNSNQLNYIIGIDHSMDSVNIARKKNVSFIEKERADIIQGNVNELPFAQNYFDIIIAVRSHYFWDNYEKSFAEIYRTLKQGGKIFIFSERYKIQYHMKKYNTDESMTSFLQTVGFNNILIENRESVQCMIAVK
jgi:ubiquinone/menaquinone biosynthesis C-methylase UbiE